MNIFLVVVAGGRASVCACVRRGRAAWCAVGAGRVRAGRARTPRKEGCVRELFLFRSSLVVSGDAGNARAGCLRACGRRLCVLVRRRDARRVVVCVCGLGAEWRRRRRLGARADGDDGPACAADAATRWRARPRTLPSTQTQTRRPPHARAHSKQRPTHHDQAPCPSPWREHRPAI